MVKETEIHNVVSFPCIQAMVQLFNVIFWFAGLSIVWMGVWMRTDFDEALSVSSTYSDMPPIVLLAAGATIIVVTSLACSCIVRVQPTLLIIYGGVLICLLFSLICVSIYVYGYKDDVINGLGSGLEQAIDNYDAMAPEPHESAIDNIQRNMHCCGNESYVDWPNEMVPTSCCISANCDVTGMKDFYDVGCFYVLEHMINSSMTTLGVIITATAFFPLFGAIFSFALASNVPVNYKIHYERII